MTQTLGQIGYASGESVDNNILSFLQRHHLQKPSDTAFKWASPSSLQAWLSAYRQSENVTGSVELTWDEFDYQQLWNAIQSAAAGLHHLGIQKGDRVLIFVPMSIDLYIAMFAVQQLGAIAVFLDSWARLEQLGYCIRHCEPRAFIAPEPAYHSLQALPELHSISLRIVTGQHAQSYDASLDSLIKTPHTVGITPVEQEHTALITYTTGSSGTPKGANRTHRFLAAQHYALNHYLPYASTDSDLPVFPIFSLNNVAAGVKTILPAINLARPDDTDGAVLIAQSLQSGATCCTLSPSLLRALSAAGIQAGLTLSALQRVATGGAPISSDDVRQFRLVAPNASVHILYGSTEVEPIAHLVADAMPDESGKEGVCVGALAKGLDYRLIRLHRGPVVLGHQGWDGLTVPDGSVGELVVSGEHVCRDYYRNPEAFASTKLVDNQQRIWHRTGDLCRVDATGQLWVVGRLHNAIHRNREWLFPVRPEVIMKRLPFVKSCAYLGLPDEALGERAVAVYTVNQEAQDDFSLRVETALTSEHIPVDAVVCVESIPLDPRHHSKVEYQKLREYLLSGI